MRVADQIAFGHGPLGSEMHGEDGYVSHQFDAVPGMTYFEWLIGQALKASANTGPFIPVPADEMAARAIDLADAVCTQLDDLYRIRQERKAAQDES